MAIVVAIALSLILQQKIPTSQMVQTSELSSVAVLLPLAAGALNLVQSERSSLVFGAAVGMLVAASRFAACGIGRDGDRDRQVGSGNKQIVLLLQLAGINLTATILLRVFGLSIRGSRYGRGKQLIFAAMLAVTVAALIGLLTWQLSQPPEFQRSTRAQRATAEIGQVIEASGTTKLV